METKPKRRWGRFAASSVVLLVAALAWVGYSLNWIRQRHEALAIPPDEAAWLEKVAEDPTLGNVSFRWYREAQSVGNPANAPAMLWLFGERGHSLIYTRSDYMVAPLQGLFPEACVMMYPPINR